jgi:hypothetical protein
MWDFLFRTSTDTHNWSPGSIGAGYIYAKTNTPDSFNLLDFNIKTWKIGPEDTQDIDREYRKERPTTPIVFRFYISPTGGIHDGGKGFQNRTNRSEEAVIDFLHRKDNRLYDGRDDIKVNRLSNTDHALGLQNFYDADQAPRLEYQDLINQNNGDWQKVKQQWIADGKGTENDVFNDISSGRSEQSKQYIKQNINEIMQDPKAVNKAWLLVQHMDTDPEFQQWFWHYLDPTKHQQEYQYLTDRMAVGQGLPQQFNTQTGASGQVSPVQTAPDASSYFAKQAWDMTPLSAAEELKLHLAGIEPKVSHTLSWVKGGKGRGLMLNDGKLITWPVNNKGEPQHPDMYEYLTNTKLPESHSIQDFVEGTPFDIYEDGTLAFFSEDVPADLILDLSKIDYRLKTSKYTPYGITPEEERSYINEHGTKIVQSPEYGYPFGSSGMGANRGRYKPFPQSEAYADTAPYPNFVPTRASDWSGLSRPKLKAIQDYDIAFTNNLISNAGYQLNSDIKLPLRAAIKNIMQSADHHHPLTNNRWGPYGPVTTLYSQNIPAEMLIANLINDNIIVPKNQNVIAKTKVAKHYLGFATHFHPYTGQECNCHYGQSNNSPALGRVASQAVRKVKNQDQKHLRGEQGQAILDYLHKLISGHGINERGEFGQGEYPGIEGMVPWIVKQLKTGWIKPFVNDDGSVADMGQLDSYYETPEEVKTILSKRAALPIDVEGMTDLGGVQESYGKNGYKFVTGEIDNPDVKIIYVNNYGDGNLDPATIQSIIAARPDAHVFVSEENRDVADALREQYRDNPLVDISNSLHAMRFIQKLVDEFPADIPIDYSINIPYTFYSNIPWNTWSDWFNATNAPAREGKDIMKMTPPEVTNSSREHQKYIRELEEIEQLKRRFADTKDEDVVYQIQDPKYKGWSVKQITNREEAEEETEVLGHCIGSDEQNYAYNIEEGNIEAFSLRDEYGIPKLTWHYNPDGTLAHVQGKSNDSYEMFRGLVTEFNAATNHDDDDGGSGSEQSLEGEEEEGEVWDEVQLPSVDSVEDYVYQYHEDGDGKWQLAGDMAADEGATLSEDVQIIEGDPDWQTIVEDLFGHYQPGENDADDFFSTIMQGSWSMNQFAQEADQYINDWEAEEYDAGGELVEVHPEPAMFDYYRQWKGMHTNPQTGQLEEPRYLGGGTQQEAYMEKHKKELENPWSFMPQWSELKTKTGEPAVSENGYARPAYLPVSQDPRYRDVATEDIDQPCERCKGTGLIPNSFFGQESEDERPCPVCKGTGKEQTPITVGPGEQRVLQDSSGQMYLGKLTVEEKAVAWDLPAHKMSKAQAKYVNGEL